MVSDDATRATDLLLEATSLLGADMARYFRSVGLTESRAHLLFLLRGGGPSTQRMLATAMAVVPRTVTGLVDGLVADDLVVRAPHPDDRRAVLVTLTETGAALATRLGDGRLELASAVFGGWDAGELGDLLAGLERAVGDLRRVTAVTTTATATTGGES